MRMPEAMRSYDDDGTELVFELGSPLWGEQGAGRDWQDTLHADLLKLGWKQAENVPAMYTFDGGAAGDGVLITIVDDLLFSESRGYAIAERTISALREIYGEVTSEREPTSFAGYRVARDWLRCAITLSMPQTIIEAMVDEHYAHFREGKPATILQGEAFKAAVAGMRLLPREESARRSAAASR